MTTIINFVKVNTLGEVRVPIDQSISIPLVDAISRLISKLLDYVVCPERSYGFYCRGVCKCSAGVNCDPFTGKCLCPVGRMGDKCEQGGWRKSSASLENAPW